LAETLGPGPIITGVDIQRGRKTPRMRRKVDEERKESFSPEKADLNTLVSFNEWVICFWAWHVRSPTLRFWMLRSVSNVFLDQVYAFDQCPVSEDAIIKIKTLRQLEFPNKMRADRTSIKNHASKDR
jgi:hypothetical protein